MSRSSAAQRDSNATQEEKQQKKHKKHSKQYSEEPTEEETQEQQPKDADQNEPTETQPKEQSEQAPQEQPKEETQKINPMNRRHQQMDEAQKNNNKDYLHFGRLFYEFMNDNGIGFKSTHPTRLIATISKIEQSEYKNKEDKPLYTVKCSVLQIAQELYNKNNNNKEWKYAEAIDIAKKYQSKYPNRYVYDYCLSESLLVTKDIVDTILKGNGIFDICVRWYKNEAKRSYKYVYNNYAQEGIKLVIPTSDEDFKATIDYYNDLLPGFVSKYTYKIYSEDTKMDLECDDERYDEVFTSKSIYGKF